MAAAISAFGRLDVVVNNAGYANVNSIEDMAEDDFRAQMETNFFGVVNVTRAALPVFRAQRGGHIIQISSFGGRSDPGPVGLPIRQVGCGRFSEVLSKEVGPLGIRVTVVEPGGMRTDWAGSSMRTDEIRSDLPSDHRRDDPALRGRADVVRGEERAHWRTIHEPKEIRKRRLKLLRLAGVGWCWESPHGGSTPEAVAEMLATDFVEARARQSPM